MPLRRALICIALVCVVLNGWFLPASSYWHRDFYEAAPLSRAARQTYIHQYAPIREVGQFMDRAHPGAPVLVTEGSDLAAFDTDVYVNHWHQYNIWKRLQLARNKWELAGILDRWNVHYVATLKPAGAVTVDPPALQELLKSCVTPEYQTNRWVLERIAPDCQPAADTKREPPLVPPGIYDDFDPALVFDGPWVEDRGWSQPYSHTITYCNSPGAEVRFKFMGRSLTYVYTKAPNRGTAGVAIDGVSKATLDLYSPNPEWQSRTAFQVGPGQHSLVITVNAARNPKSSDQFIDVDAFEVQ